MIYRKPKNVTLTDMCIYIDKTAYTDEHDAQTIYEYLYFRIRHFAMRERWFHRIEYYDDGILLKDISYSSQAIDERRYRDGKAYAVIHYDMDGRTIKGIEML